MRKLLALVVCLFVSVCGTGRAERVLEPVGKEGPIAEDLYHVQGLSVGTGTIYISAVDKAGGRALLWEIDRETHKVRRVKDYAEHFYIHPSGLQYDGRSIRMAIAMYTEKSAAVVLEIDPETMKVRSRFRVKDHIGLVTSDGAGRLIGGNWDARIFYVWDEKGKLIEKHENPTEHGYQDCKLHGEMLTCSGGGYLDEIDTETWKLVSSIEVGTVESGNKGTREGMDRVGEEYYFAPDDGAGTYIYEFRPMEE